MIAREPRVAHVVHFLRLHIRPNRNNAAAAQRHHGQNDIVVAREHAEVIGQVARDFRRIANIARSLFDAESVGMLRQARDILLGNRAPRTTRHVVQDTGNINRIEHRGEMTVDALFVRLVVVRRDKQQTIGAHLLEAQALFEHGLRTVRAAARDNRHASCHAIDDELAHLVVFLMRHGRRFARGAQREQGVGSVFQMEVDQAAKRLKINAAVFSEWRDERHNGAAQTFHVCHVLSFRRFNKRRSARRCEAAGRFV